ncbi:YibE/F family protein [Geosporobacter ferrireducens]|uniref:YibE/F family protein n=1 Tax=Geosporobacter ferrireducens TaxID=1424294 RepID=A0A1D8GCA4_9FIRM|nr:YibE/F family protein [Geosporobacter ferrireducens]AOT68544.1 YibE/F family protein [Geosporobacter ferrireducens]MTI54010.1 YibE/F family protein [Geosporobacter ferrireducens]
MKKLLLCVFVFLMAAFSISLAEPVDSYTETAIVIGVDDIEDSSDEMSGVEQIQTVQLKITSGKYKNEVFEVHNNLSGSFVYDIPVKVGDKIVVVVDELENGDIDVFVADYMRQDYILYLYLIFVILLLLIGRIKGLKSVISLTVTIFAVLKILLPLILSGVNPVPVTVFVSIGITVITLFIIAGVNSKSIAAIIGTTTGVIVAGLLAYYIGSKIKLTGLSSEEATMLLYIPQEVNFDFKGLLFSGIIMGALGAVMDIGMSIASAMDEIYRANPKLHRKELFMAGMNVGRDVMGTMTNTLILAYTGSSIPLLLIFMAYETSLVKILNLDIIATEVVRALSGSTGLILTIPITAAVSSVLLIREAAKKEKKQ